MARAYGGKWTIQVQVERTIKFGDKTVRSPNALSGNQTLFNSVTHQFCVVLQPEFLQHPQAVRTDVFDAERQFGSDLADGFASGQHTQDLIFAVGQGFVCGSVGICLEIECKPLRQSRTDISSAANNLADCRNKI